MKTLILGLTAGFILLGATMPAHADEFGEQCEAYAKSVTTEKDKQDLLAKNPDYTVEGQCECASRNMTDEAAKEKALVVLTKGNKLLADGVKMEDLDKKIPQDEMSNILPFIIAVGACGEGTAK